MFGKCNREKRAHAAPPHSEISGKAALSTRSDSRPWPRLPQLPAGVRVYFDFGTQARDAEYDSYQRIGAYAGNREIAELQLSA
jgi:hypothetical protein